MLYQNMLQHGDAFICLQTLMNDRLNVTVYLERSTSVKVPFINDVRRLYQPYLHISLSKVVADRVKVDKTDVGMSSRQIGPKNIDNRPNNLQHIKQRTSAHTFRIAIPSMTYNTNEEEQYNKNG